MRAFLEGQPADALFTAAPRRHLAQRALQLAPVRVVVGLFLLAPAGFVETFAMRRPTALGRAAGAFAATLAFLLLQAVYARVIERRPPRELALRGAAVELAAGVVLGLTLLSATVVLLVAAGLYRLTWVGAYGALAHGLVLFPPHALLEELVMRALLFKVTEESLGSRAALVSQALLFGLLHLGNPGGTWIAALAIALEAGILLGVAYMLTRRIWFVWGIHLAWNFAQGSLFGIAVSGHPSSAALFASEPRGAPLLSGGAFGVEASPVAVVVCLVASVALWRLAARRGQVLGYRARRARARER